VVRKSFNWGKVAGLLPKDYENPALGIARFPERKRQRFITTVEMPCFIRALAADDDEYARHGLWLLLLLGLRSKELLNAKWTDIDWNMGTLFVGLTKNGEPLLAPLSDAVLAHLRIIPGFIEATTSARTINCPKELICSECFSLIEAGTR
jgi:integrase